MFEGNLKLGGGPVESLAFSPSGSLLAVGHHRGGGCSKKAPPALSLVELSKSKPKPKPLCLVTTFDEDLVSSPGGWIGMVTHVEFVSDAELLLCFDGNDARTITLDGRKGLPVGPKAPYTEYYDLHGALAVLGGFYFWAKQSHDHALFALRQREGKRDQVLVSSNEQLDTRRVLPLSVDEVLVHAPDARRLMVASFASASARPYGDVEIGVTTRMSRGGDRVLVHHIGAQGQTLSVLFEADGRVRSQHGSATAISADGRYLAEGIRKPGTESYSFMKPEHRGWVRVTDIGSEKVVFEERVSEDYEVGTLAFSGSDSTLLGLASKSTSDIRVHRWAGPS